MDRKLRKLVVFAAICMLTVCATCATVSAETYSTEYPDVYNSGSPLWLHCEVAGMGEYIIVIDPNANPQSFGFDAPWGYNLINNTGSNIYARAYNIDTGAGIDARWQPFYTLEFKSGYNNNGVQNVYEPYSITAIYGTTLDLIDHRGDRGNDTLSGEELKFGYEVAQTFVIVVLGLCMLIRPWFEFTYRQRGKLSMPVQS